MPFVSSFGGLPSASVGDSTRAQTANRERTAALAPRTGPAYHVDAPSAQAALGGLLGVHDDGRSAPLDHVLVDQDLADVRLRGDVVHDVEHRLLEDGAEAA